MKDQLAAISTLRGIRLRKRQTRECRQIVSKTCWRNETNGIPARIAYVFESERVNIARASPIIRTVRLLSGAAARCSALVRRFKHLAPSNRPADSSNGQIGDTTPTQATPRTRPMTPTLPGRRARAPSRSGQLQQQSPEERTTHCRKRPRHSQCVDVWLVATNSDQTTSYRCQRLEEPSAQVFSYTSWTIQFAYPHSLPPSVKVSDGNQPPMTLNLFLGEEAGYRSRHRFGPVVTSSAFPGSGCG